MSAVVANGIWDLQVGGSFRRAGSESETSRLWPLRLNGLIDSFYCIGTAIFWSSYWLEPDQTRARPEVWPRV